MTTKCRIFLPLLFMLFQLCAFADSWVLAAQKFTFSGNQSQKVGEGIALMFPSRILEKIRAGSERTIASEEQLDRDSYNLKNERVSLFLQLSSEIKKRDSIVLNDYTQRELKKKLSEADKKIKEIKEKINDNMSRQEELLKKTEELPSSKATSAVLEQRNGGSPPAADFQSENSPREPPLRGDNSYSAFFRRLFSSQEDEVVTESVSIYKNDVTSLYSPPDTAVLQGIESAAFEKEVVSAKINGLLSGNLTLYDDYVFLSVDLYVFPGAKKIASVNDVGTRDDADLIAASVARQLLPSITNSMPVHFVVEVSPPDADVQLYVDDVLQRSDVPELIVDSGVHFIQFVAEGYKNAGTSYYFSGNKSYKIQATLAKADEGELAIRLKNPIEGDFYANGILASKNDDNKAQIKINGNAILGEFITEENHGSFFYVPDSLAVADSALFVTADDFDRSEFIEKRRRTMYTAYSTLVTSLIPMMVCLGQVNNYSASVQYLSGDDITKANIWSAASSVTIGLSIGCGAWFVFELVRYLMAANKVLPVTARTDKALVHKESDVTAADEVEE